MIGGFVQGMGWVTTEDLRYSDKGALLSYSPTTYKIPNIMDVPDQFHCDVVDNETQSMCEAARLWVSRHFAWGISVWLAAKHALSFVSGEEVPAPEAACNGRGDFCLA